MTEPGWELWRSFLAVGEGGSLSAAARALGLTQPTIGRYIDALEAALGAPLFTRAPGGMTPTDLGRALLPEARGMASAAAALRRAAAAGRDAVAGTVRISASAVVGVHVLPPILAALRVRHPDLQLELDVSDRNADLLRRDADVAVRMVRPSQTALVARRLGEVGVGLYAHRAYLDRRGAPADVDDLRGHDLIGPEAPLPALLALGLSPDRFAMRSDSDLAQLAAVRAGAGIGACQHALARGWPELAPVLPVVGSFRLEAWVVAHADLVATPRVRAVFDHLVAALTGWAE